MFIKAKNGNVVETEDADHAKRALADGHEVFETDPRIKGKKPKVWNPEGSDEADDESADTGADD